MSSATKMRICTLAVLLTAAAAMQPSVAWALQLPPDIQTDRYLARAERQIEEQNFAGAKESIDQILELQKQHDIELPEEFYFRYAEVLVRLGLHDEAASSATRYLTLVGREGEHYHEALELLDEVESSAPQQPQAGKSRAFDGMEFVWVPEGEFRMGSTSLEADDNERPLTQVRISRGYWLGKYEVTQAEWLAVMGANPSKFPKCGSCPVEKVSWDDAQGFIRRLNALSEGARYRLPTEAEWEYAARAGTRGERYSEDIDTIAWYKGNVWGRTKPVGQKEPNAWGLHDMLGNVWEWVQDWHGGYPGGSVTDPVGPGSGSYRVTRGGAWIFSAGRSRAATRFERSPGHRRPYLGFRLLRTE